VRTCPTGKTPDGNDDCQACAGGTPFVNRVPTRDICVASCPTGRAPDGNNECNFCTGSTPYIGSQGMGTGLVSHHAPLAKLQMATRNVEPARAANHMLTRQAHTSVSTSALQAMHPPAATNAQHVQEAHPTPTTKLATVSQLALLGRHQTNSTIAKNAKDSHLLLTKLQRSVSPHAHLDRLQVMIRTVPIVPEASSPTMPPTPASPNAPPGAMHPMHLMQIASTVAQRHRRSPHLQAVWQTALLAKPPTQMATVKRALVSSHLPVTMPTSVWTDAQLQRCLMATATAQPVVDRSSQTIPTLRASRHALGHLHPTRKGTARRARSKLPWLMLPRMPASTCALLARVQTATKCVLRALAAHHTGQPKDASQTVGKGRHLMAATSARPAAGTHRMPTMPLRPVWHRALRGSSKMMTATARPAVGTSTTSTPSVWRSARVAHSAKATST